MISERFYVLRHPRVCPALTGPGTFSVPKSHRIGQCRGRGGLSLTAHGDTRAGPYDAGSESVMWWRHSSWTKGAQSCGSDLWPHALWPLFSCVWALIGPAEGWSVVWGCFWFHEVVACSQLVCTWLCSINANFKIHSICFFSVQISGSLPTINLGTLLQNYTAERRTDSAKEEGKQWKELQGPIFETRDTWAKGERFSLCPVGEEGGMPLRNPTPGSELQADRPSHFFCFSVTRLHFWVAASPASHPRF